MVRVRANSSSNLPEHRNILPGILLSFKGKQIYQCSDGRSEEGRRNEEWPAIEVPVYRTDQKGTFYLKNPGVAVVARTVTSLQNLSGFLHGFDDDLRFGEYLNEGCRAWRVVEVVEKEGKTEFIPDVSEGMRLLPDAALLVKVAMIDPIVFRDFDVVTYADGTQGVTTPYPKV